MADARGDEAYQDFIIPWTFHLKGFDLQGAAFFAQNSRLNPVNLRVGMTIHRSAPLLPTVCAVKAYPSTKRAEINFTSLAMQTSTSRLICISHRKILLFECFKFRIWIASNSLRLTPHG
jgi:hypothetical protein